MGQSAVRKYRKWETAGLIPGKRAIGQMKSCRLPELPLLEVCKSVWSLSPIDGQCGSNRILGSEEARLRAGLRPDNRDGQRAISTGKSACGSEGCVALPVFCLVSLVSVSARNWCYSCGRVEGVEKGAIVEIASIDAVFMQVSENMLG